VRGNMKTEGQVRCYLNSKVNVEGNPFDNLYLYKHGLRQKGIDESNPEFYDKKNMDKYIRHMHHIGWNQAPVSVEKNRRIRYPGSFLDKFILDSS